MGGMTKKLRILTMDAVTLTGAKAGLKGSTDMFQTNKQFRTVFLAHTMTQLFAISQGNTISSDMRMQPMFYSC